MMQFQNEEKISKLNMVHSLERTPSSQGKNPQNFPYTNVQIFEQYIYYPPSEMVICICIIEWKSSSFHGTVQFERSGASSHKAFLLIRGKMFEGATFNPLTLQGLIWEKISTYSYFMPRNNCYNHHYYSKEKNISSPVLV